MVGVGGEKRIDFRFILELEFIGLGMGKGG